MKLFSAIHVWYTDATLSVFGNSSVGNTDCFPQITWVWNFCGMGACFGQFLIQESKTMMGLNKQKDLLLLIQSN